MKRKWFLLLPFCLLFILLSSCAQFLNTGEEQTFEDVTQQARDRSKSIGGKDDMSLGGDTIDSYVPPKWQYTFTEDEDEKIFDDGVTLINMGTLEDNVFHNFFTIR